MEFFYKGAKLPITYSFYMTKKKSKVHTKKENKQNTYKNETK